MRSRRSKLGSAARQTEGAIGNTTNLIGYDDMDGIDGSMLRSFESQKEEMFENHSNTHSASKAHSIILPKKKMVELQVPTSMQSKHRTG